MLPFLEKFEENVKNYPDKIILVDNSTPKGITTKQLDMLSGRVYAYLQDQGIGREDFVMLCLPRGIQPLIAILGVWKNGSAFVLVEDTYAPERIEFIRKDCGCKLVINSDVWEQIQNYTSKTGREKSDEHDAAFAVYTSGTTGNPKGVLHEYGNIERMVDSTCRDNKSSLADPEDRFALVAPLNFVASLLIYIYGIYWCVRNYVVAYSVVKNPLSIGLFIMKNRITGTFLTPSYIRRMKAKPASLKFCIIGSEPANDVYLEGLKIHNFYLMSESGFALAHFIIDKPYEQTPVGKPDFDHEILLLDEQGNPVPEGTEGEVCFENRYVRGYINLPEETEKVFQNGIYHSGDLAFRREDGELVICGRLNDMVKINGNRVEPGEIEGVAKKVLGIDWAAARIIDDGRQVYICVYYLDKKLKVDFEKTREAMAKYLPYYMLPSYFIHIDSVPLRATGKMDRKALPEPVIDDFRSEYVAPEGEMETALCEAFEKVLHVNKVGMKDDFYQLGGDSLGAMDVLVESGIKGLSTADIFAGHTPEKILEIYHEKHPDGVTETDDERDERSRKQVHPLSAYQSYMIDYQLYTPISTMLNLFIMLKFDKKNLDINKVADALLATVKNHPALLSVFHFSEDGEIVQEYKPELAEPIQIEKCEEIEMDIIKDALVRPFKIINGRLYRLRLFETEKNGYIFFDVHHTVFDGTSFQVLIQDIVKAYYDMPQEHDYYYKMLLDKEDLQKTERYLADKAYFENLYDGDDFCFFPKPDFESRENDLDHYFCGMASNEEAMEKVEEKYGISRNAFFSLAAMLSIAVYNRQPNIQISWTYNGRDDLQKVNSVGLLLCDLPLALRLQKSQLITDLFKDIQKQVAGGIEHSAYPYTFIDQNAVSDDNVCFLYQEDIRDGGSGDGMEEMGIESIDIRQNKAASENILDIQILDGKEGLGLMLDYASSRYRKSSMERFAAIYVAVAETLMATVGKEKMTVIDVIKAAGKKTGNPELWIRWIK